MSKSGSLRGLSSGAPEDAQSREISYLDWLLACDNFDPPPDTVELVKENDMSRSFPKAKRKARSYHKGVHLKQSNNKFVARLCLPGGKKKLELGEYQCHEEAARAYEVGAFYYQKSASGSFQDELPPVPDKISEEEKRTWVSDIARQYAREFADGGLGSGCSSFVYTGGNLTDASTPATSGAPPTPVASDADNFVSSQSDHDLEVRSVDRRSRRALANLTRWIPRNSRLELLRNRQDEHTHVPQLKMTDSILFAQCELQRQGWMWTLKPSRPSTSSKTGKVLFSLPKGQAVPALLMTDIIINSFYELRDQGWEVHLEASKRDNIQWGEKNDGDQNLNWSDALNTKRPKAAAASPRPPPQTQISPSPYTTGTSSPSDVGTSSVPDLPLSPFDFNDFNDSLDNSELLWAYY